MGLRECKIAPKDHVKQADKVTLPLQKLAFCNRMAHISQIARNHFLQYLRGTPKNPGLTRDWEVLNE